MPPGGSGSLPNVGPQYIVTPLVSHGWAVGVLWEIHILIVAFIMGAAWIIAVTGFFPDRPEYKRFERFTHTFAKWLEQTYSFGATFAVFAITFVIPLFPRYFAVLVAAMPWQLGIIIAAWVAMTFSLLIYYFMWEKWRPRHRYLHQCIILFYAISETVFIVFITQYTAYQVNPPVHPDPISAISNPIWFPAALHRVAGNLSYAGYLMAAWGAWRYFRKRRVGTSVDKAFYQWSAHVGFMWALGFELAQLPIGTYYVLALQFAGPIGYQTYSKMMLTPGSTSMEWLLQILVLSVMFVLADIYMWATIRSIVNERRGLIAVQHMLELAPAAATLPLVGQQGDVPRQLEHAQELGRQLPRDAVEVRRVDRFAELWTGYGIWVVALAGAMACIPDNIPVIGSMNWKWGCLGVFLIWSAVSLVLYVIVTRRATWGNMPRTATWALMIGGITIMFLMVVMGTIRYTNPQTAYISSQSPVPAIHVQSILTPIP